MYLTFNYADQYNLKHGVGLIHQQKLIRLKCFPDIADNVDDTLLQMHHFSRLSCHNSLLTWVKEAY